MPTYFPPFRHDRIDFMSGHGGESRFHEARRRQPVPAPAAKALSTQQIARELEKRVAVEEHAGLKELVHGLHVYAAAGDLDGKALVLWEGYESNANADAVTTLEERRRRDGAAWKPSPDWVGGALLECSNRMRIARASSAHSANCDAAKRSL